MTIKMVWSCGKGDGGVTRRTSDKVAMVSVAMMIAMERKVMNWS
jgi:hypothetical protein